MYQKYMNEKIAKCLRKSELWRASMLVQRLYCVKEKIAYKAVELTYIGIELDNAVDMLIRDDFGRAFS